MLLLSWKDFSMTLRLSGSANGWLLGLLVTPRLRRYRLSGGCPIGLRVGIHSDSLSRPTRHLPPSTVHLLSRCNSSNNPRDSRFCLITGRGTSLGLVSSVARKATMLESVCRTSLRSLLSPQLTLIWSSRQLSRRRCQLAALGKLISLRLRKSCRINRWWLVCLPLIPIQLMCYLILVHHIHSWAWSLHRGIIYLLWLFLLPRESILWVRSCALTLRQTLWD